jgi:major membrane immunogen (membrane-anchored lipoprotein)
MNFIKDWQDKTINYGEYKIIYVTRNSFDLFMGQGWKNRMRIYFDRKNNVFKLPDYYTKPIPNNALEVLRKVIV